MVGGSGEWGEVKINQTATPTVHCPWGVERCIYKAEIGVAIDRVCKRKRLSVSVGRGVVARLKYSE